MDIRIGWIILLALQTLALGCKPVTPSSSSSDLSAPSNAISVTLRVSSKEQVVLADLIFSNNSQKAAHLFGPKACLDGTITSKVFTITSNGQELPYEGIIAKIEPTKDDFLKIEPGKSVSTQVTLSDYYSFVPGQHCTAIYRAFNQSPSEDGPLTQLESNEVEFDFE